ncbi:MAG: hypothetical protein OXH22_13545 [Chloroflexi bacterium]|nr:hypothetical protein [Chloroflexota bacterium]
MTGESGVRSFEFLVDTGSSYVGLPLDDIEALGLYKFPGGKFRLMTAMGIMESDSYAAQVRIGEDRAPAHVIVAPIPIIGYELLQKLRMRVNPVTQSLEKVPLDEEVFPPFLLI